MQSTSARPGLRFAASWIASEGQEAQDEFLAALTPEDLLALQYLFEFWAMEHQLPPEGAWRAWVALGGRGAGKTRAGAEWVRAMVEGALPLQPGMAGRVALVGETYEQVRDVMVFGQSGIIACSPPDRRPHWEASRRRLVWPNGATAQAFSASDPESLRGPQFDCAWADEYGCAAIDKGTNQPNKFLDAKSSESKLPHHSNGMRDDLIQFQYLRAMAGYWNDPANNPVSAEYGGPMIDMDHAYVWAWDARPYPFFPNDGVLWSDAPNHARGHWVTGRLSSWRLASAVEETCRAAGLEAIDTEGLHGLVRGTLVEQVAEPRAILQPLILRHGFDAVERGGALRFRLRDGRADHAVDMERLVRNGEIDGLIEETRGSAAELAGRVRLRFIEADADFDIISEEAILPDTANRAVATSEIGLAMTRAEGRQTAERWLAEARVARDRVRLTLPRSRLGLGAGDVLALTEVGGEGLFRIDRVEMMAHAQTIEAVRVEPESYAPVPFEPVPGKLRAFSAPALLAPFFLDLPLITGSEVPHQPYVAVSGTVWPGSAAVYTSDEESGFTLDRILEARTPVGITQGPLLPAASGLVDRGAPLAVKMLHGTLESASQMKLLNGANLCAISDGSPGNWELLQFAEAELVGPGLYALGHRLRGQLGTEHAEPWPTGSYLVRLDGTPQQLGLPQSALGLDRYYRVGPGNKPVDDASYVQAVLAFHGTGLRPLSPVHLRAARGAGGALELSWMRRTRIGGDSWEMADVPLGEESEAYHLRVMQGAAVLREVTVTSPAWSYGAALQAADGLAGLFQIEVAQVSTQYGPGRYARLSLSA
ncbi:MAG: glycoside hydrolase TIM-barrel-like domain-containing protein [Roseovarius sp.]